MYYTIYQTTNIINQKIYIGKHQTKVIDDRYLGSGKNLKRAIKKYGVENFRKEVLFVFDNEADMNAKEAELVTEDFCALENNYNICSGGKGGFSFINKNNLAGTSGQISSFDDRIKKGNIKYTHLMNNDPEWKAWRNKKVSEGVRRYFLHNPGTFTGREHTDITKQKVRDTRVKNKSGIGQKNSQYGTCWIYKDSTNYKIKKEDLDNYIQNGYNIGRKLKG